MDYSGGEGQLRLLQAGHFPSAPRVGGVNLELVPPPMPQSMVAPPAMHVYPPMAAHMPNHMAGYMPPVGGGPMPVPMAMAPGNMAIMVPHHLMGYGPPSAG